ncbi:TetR/AcrR family transcriptional regulator [Nocardia uniformis]|uniref:TetR/AcrR family transcriptional regulator n=1 Tax=Nocardia uniformis TaxID=53432 RepID=A0A849BU15_9NOCA|nr:TetR/AcrR family transcriptional regulator [Nocardia uniformis]NNH68478.1 TetR/AcrR family transcriptional regulator [Nocardia uniformis]
MPRPIDPQRHRARQLQIVDAGLTAFAEHGYAGATTAVICRIAGIGSGTFFHYFPTKDALLVAILEQSAAETREFFEQQADAADPRRVLHDYVEHAVSGLIDPRAAGFISVVGGLTHRPEIARALHADDETARTALQAIVRTAQHDRRVRVDVDAERLAEWIVLLLDGFAARVATNDNFVAEREKHMLNEQVGFLLGDRAQPVPNEAALPPRFRS